MIVHSSTITISPMQVAGIGRKALLRMADGLQRHGEECDGVVSAMQVDQSFGLEPFFLFFSVSKNMAL